MSFPGAAPPCLPWIEKWGGMADRNPLKRLPAEAKAWLRKKSQPNWVAPMLATLTNERFSRERWLFEPKWDGERCLAFRRGCELSLFSRNRILLNEKYPEIMKVFHQQDTDFFIADGEIVTFKDGITSFARLQERMQVKHPSADLLRRVPVWLYLFDLLYLGHYDTRGVPLRYRKDVLRNTFDFKGSLRFTEHRETEGEDYYRKACRSGWEGVIAKNGDSVYVSRRTRDWLKFKCSTEQEFVVGGYTEPRGNRIGFGALLLGYYRGRKLVYAGKVGTGFDRDALRRLGKKLAELEAPSSPFESDGLPRGGVHWVKPRLVAQIAFTEWTREGKLRHPRFLGLREDKRPGDVVREN
jgi:bifunctional non-homologous end joining protein LigD